MSLTLVGEAPQPADDSTCWCCGLPHPESVLTRLGAHPEVAVCTDCAHFLHRRARAQHDESRPTPGSRVRAVVQRGRAAVMARGWHQKRAVGRLLRGVNRHLP